MLYLIQIPTEVPHPDNNAPIDFSNPFELLVYVVAPVAMIVLYIVLRKKRKKKQSDQQNNKA